MSDLFKDNVFFDKNTGTIFSKEEALELMKEKNKDNKYDIHAVSKKDLSIKDGLVEKLASSTPVADRLNMDKENNDIIDLEEQSKLKRKDMYDVIKDMEKESGIIDEQEADKDIKNIFEQRKPLGTPVTSQNVGLKGKDIVMAMQDAMPNFQKEKNPKLETINGLINQVERDTFGFDEQTADKEIDNIFKSKADPSQRNTEGLNQTTITIPVSQNNKLYYSLTGAVRSPNEQNIPHKRDGKRESLKFNKYVKTLKSVAVASLLYSGSKLKSTYNEIKESPETIEQSLDSQYNEAKSNICEKIEEYAVLQNIYNDENMDYYPSVYWEGADQIAVKCPDFWSAFYIAYDEMVNTHHDSWGWDETIRCINELAKLNGKSYSVSGCLNFEDFLKKLGFFDKEKNEYLLKEFNDVGKKYVIEFYQKYVLGNDFNGGARS